MSSKKPKVLQNFFQKILGSRGKAPWRNPQIAKRLSEEAHFLVLFCKKKRTRGRLAQTIIYGAKPYPAFFLLQKKLGKKMRFSGKDFACCDKRLKALPSKSAIF